MQSGKGLTCIALFDYSKPFDKISLR